MDEEEKKKYEELLGIMDDKCLEYFKLGYENGKKKPLNELLEDNCIKDYIDGYKSGFKDGYKMAMAEIVKEVGLQPGFEGEGQPGWPWPKLTLP